ncbi:TlpA family protein disulfide reductase [Dyella choica]|uniref:TlpA family protein disulfide reductase n=1 Tax=Dyella choica TaxID=1927959 RepID=A0A432M3U8_9GAMM|nr:TlpA disulfide reductase family protein [Dyella choica]RUL73689.1 TlpA family protein disulfide reductase [Dyella choica]
MRRLTFLLSLACLTAITHAANVGQDEQPFLASLQLGATPRVQYLDANGKPLDYAAFALQMHDGRRHYSVTRDTQAGMAVLRLRPAGARAGEPGRFAFGRGDTFPPFELPSLRGATQRLSDFHGRYTLVSFFFAECAPCIAEVPTLNAYAREHGDMNFIAITFENADNARQFVSQRGLGWNVLYHGQALTDTLGVGTYPTLMLLTPDGQVAGSAVGTSMQDEPAKRLADLAGWIEQWKRAAMAPPPDGKPAQR